MRKRNIYIFRVIVEPIYQIEKVDEKRAREVTSFYIDLEKSIKQVADSVKKGGKAIYVVGNRTVKNVPLPTDQYIAEKFEENGFSHLVTYERALSNKTMQLKILLLTKLETLLAQC